MRNIGIFVLIAVISLFVVSCNGDVSVSEPTQNVFVGSVDMPLTSLGKGESIIVDQVGAETTIELSDFSLEDGIYIEIVENGRSRAVTSFNSEKMFKRQDGSFIPIPGQQGNISFTGGDLGLSDVGRVIIHRLLNLDDDFEIRAKEPQHLLHSTEFIAEEFYYVSFLDPRFVSLDPREVVFVTSGVGHQGVSVLQYGMLNKRAEGVYDFSGKWFTGFAVNMFKSMIVNSDDSVKLFIMNPIHATSSQNELNNQINVIMVEKQTAGKYNVVVSFSGEDASDVIYNIATSGQALQYKPRYTNGDFRGNYFYPEFDFENKKIIYHIGSVERDFLFDLYFDESTGFKPGMATVSLEEDTSGFEPVDATQINEVVITAPSKGLVTWYYKADSPVEIETERVNHPAVWNMTVSDHGLGTGGFNEQMTLDGYGFFIFEYTGNGTDVPLVSIRRSVKRGLDCSAVAWDYETEDYVCIDDDCKHCINQGSKQHYSRFFIEHNRDEIFHDARFWTLASYGSYGRISWKIPHSVKCTENSSISVETFGGDSRFPAPPRAIATNANNRSQMVKLYLQKIILPENKIVVDIAIGDPEIWYRNVEMYASPITSEQQTTDYIKFSGVLPAQRAFSTIDVTGMTTKYVNGDTEIDINDSIVWSNAADDSVSWGNAVVRYNDRWQIPRAVFRAKYNSGLNGPISYILEGEPLHGQFAPNTPENVITFPNQAGSFVTLNVSDKFADAETPITDSKDDGYLVNGIRDGKNVWAVFSYEDYVNKTPINLKGLLDYATDLGAQIGDTEQAPTFGDFKNDGTLVFCTTVNGTGSPDHVYVVVVGRLKNKVSPSNCEISINNFDEGYETFFFKTTATN